MAARGKAPRTGTSRDMAGEFRAFHEAVKRSKMVLSVTPAKVCTKAGALDIAKVDLARLDGSPNEQFYKWQLVSALIATGRVPSDQIGCELSVPRGSRGSTDLFVDVAIFSDPTWSDIYDGLVKGHVGKTWEDLLKLLVGCCEIKDDPSDAMERTIDRQLIPALNSVSIGYSLGVYYNAGHLILITRSTEEGGVVLSRLDPAKQGPPGGLAVRLNPSVPDRWESFPSLATILKRGNGGVSTSRKLRTIDDLDVMSSRSQRPIEDALNSINRVLDAASLKAEVGYRTVVETLAAKVFDEKESRRAGTPLEFYIDPGEEPPESGLVTGPPAAFMRRLQRLHAKARPHYPSILVDSVIAWSNPAHLRVIAEVVHGFQDISLVRSDRSDLYQVVFYNFAAPLSKVAQAQFMTPIRVIDFMVEIVNPKPGESVLDPTMGIADFLAVTFDRGVKRGARVNDEDLYGTDNDPNMLMLAGLNMLLNGDGKANLHHIPDTGYLDHKLAINRSSKVVPISLSLSENQNGKWELPSGSGFTLKTFDIVLTNPPFGEDRALRLNDPSRGTQNRNIVSLYDVHNVMTGEKIDKGLLFLENALNSIATPGRMGIILSTAIASVKDYEPARQWFMDKARLVAVIDLPENTFAETGVPTTLVFAYKCDPTKLARLQKLPYEVFTHEVKRTGFTKVTRNRNTFLVEKYLVDPTTGRVRSSPESGDPMLDEEFSGLVGEFRTWARTQEAEMQKLFL